MWASSLSQNSTLENSESPILRGSKTDLCTLVMHHGKLKSQYDDKKGPVGCGGWPFRFGIVLTFFYYFGVGGAVERVLEFPLVSFSGTAEKVHTNMAFQPSFLHFHFSFPFHLSLINNWLPIWSIINHHYSCLSRLF